MNKFITPLPAGGVPITNEDILMIQNSAHEAVAAICNGIDSGFVLSGCIATQSGSNVSISSGYVFLDGQVMRFDGYSGTFPIHIRTGAPQKVQRMYRDGFNKDTTVETMAVTSTGVPSTGSYVTFNPQPNKTLKSVIMASLSTKVDLEINDRIAGDNLLNNRITTEVNNLSSSKANKIQPAWIAPTLTTNYGTSNVGWASPSYMKDEFGFVRLQGHLRLTNIAGNQEQCFTLPVGYRPSANLYFTAGVDNVDFQGRVLIQPSGVVSFFTKNTSLPVGFTLDGISFKAEQ